MIKLLIFDFDGTLADTQELIVRTNQEVMRAMNHPVLPPEGITPTIGLPLEEGIRNMMPDIGPEQLPQWVKTYRRVFDTDGNMVAEGLLNPLLPTGGPAMDTYYEHN